MSFSFVFFVVLPQREARLVMVIIVLGSELSNLHTYLPTFDPLHLTVDDVQTEFGYLYDENVGTKSTHSRRIQKFDTIYLLLFAV